jgi:hypothetical protein
MRDLKSLGLRLLCCLAIVLTPALAVAGEVPEAVRVACSDDYQKYCIKHQPGSESGRECMADVFEKLTETCVSAIMNSDLVGEEPVPEASESTVAKTVTPAPTRRVAKTRSKPKARVATKARKKRRTRRFRSARNVRKYRVRDRRNDARKVRRRKVASRKSRRRTYASRRRGRISRRISRGLRIADRRVSRALRRAFRF